MTVTSMVLVIVSAEKELFRGTVHQLTVTGGSGELGIHPGHTALLTAVKPGYIKFIKEGGEEDVYYISGGYLEVQPEEVILLSDVASRAEDLDEHSAQVAKEQAEAALSNKVAEVDYSSAIAELAEASAQLRAIQMLRKNIKK